MSYNDNLPADTQIDAEEAIASILFDDAELDEDLAGEMGRKLLLWVLERFRPDLCDPPRPGGAPWVPLPGGDDGQKTT